MPEYFSELYDVLAGACSRSKSGAIALSGGLDSTILGYLLKRDGLRGVTVIASDFIATDLTYCQAVAKKLDIQLTIIHVGTADILDGIEKTISMLGNFNDIEIRNSIIMYVALKWAKNHDISGIISGDGADELFAGYNFLLAKQPAELEAELERIRKIMHFPSHQLGEKIGINVESPYLDSKVVKIADKIPASLKVKKDGKIWGKWILRKTFEGIIPAEIAWRPKSPMQDGAGTVGLTGLFEAVISDEIFSQKKKQILKEDNITIRTKESMHYYETYRKIHGPYDGGSAQDACTYCGFPTGGSKFCRMCGAFPI